MTNEMILAHLNGTKARDARIARAAATYAYSPKSWRPAYTSIYDAYKSPSVHKVRAFWRCKNLCSEFNGYDLVISAAGCQTFSVCFKFTAPDGRPCYAYITRDYDRFCYADEKPAA